MIDNFALGITHALMMLAAWRLLRRPDLESETPSPPAAPMPVTRQRTGA